MSNTVFTSTLWHHLKDTLEEIVDDKTDGIEGGLVYKRWMKERRMPDAYIDDQEVGGPGLLSEKPEGGELSVGTMREGYSKRYIARTFGLRMMITEEAMEDVKYQQVIKLGKRLKRAAWKTVEYDAASVPARAWNPDYPGGDGQPLFSTAHTLPHGGTYSNTMATPMSPSVLALTIMDTAIRTLPGHDGLIEGYELKKVVCPVQQRHAWARILKSDKDPQAGNFAAINTAKSEMDVEVVPVKYWTNTTTNWFGITDAEGGPVWLWRRKIRSRTWYDNNNEVAYHSVTYRSDKGWTDARSAYGSEA